MSSRKRTAHQFTLFFSGASAVATREKVLQMLSEQFFAGLQSTGTKILTKERLAVTAR
jgi:hypothetical protein